MKNYDRNNFHRHTFCVFTEVAPEVISGLKPNYKSKSGSSYFFTDEGVFRLSNHWGRAANCKWRLQSADTVSTGRERVGYAKWTEFHPDNTVERLYFIEVDFDTETAHYEHKSNLAPDSAAMLRTASETEKTIRQIRKLFESDNWTHYFIMETNELRRLVITEMVTSEKTLQQIKSAIHDK